jgi:mycothiol synthase
VILYVEADNKPALAVYRRLGFRTLVTDVQYELAPAASG